MKSRIQRASSLVICGFLVVGAGGAAFTAIMRAPAANAAAACDQVDLTGGALPDPYVINTGCVALNLNGQSTTATHIEIKPNNELDIIDLVGGGTLDVDAGPSGAGIHTTEATLKVKGGTLTVIGGLKDAAIGGNEGEDGGTESFEGGKVTAQSAAAGAGIGGGARHGDQGGNGGHISVSGGDITAVGDSLGAAFGGGDSGEGGKIDISGGSVHAETFGSGAALGGGRGGNSGEITVSGGEITASSAAAAGIGSGDGGNAVDKIHFLGGHITATGGSFSAAVGGADDSDGGDILIDGATLQANGGPRGSAIGGGFSGHGGVITILQSTDQPTKVTATAGSKAAGLGGGQQGDGGAVTIGAGAEVSVDTLTHDGYTAVGGGLGNNPSDVPTSFGSLSLGGTLDIRGDLVINSGPTPGQAAQIVIDGSGKIRGSAGTPTQGAVIKAGVGGGPVQIDNHGVIALEEDLVTVPVTDHNYLVRFHNQGENAVIYQTRLFAPNFDTGYRIFLDPPANTEWNTHPDGTGTVFKSDTLATSDPLELYPVAATSGSRLAQTGADLSIACLGLFWLAAGWLLTRGNKWEATR